MGKLFDRVVRMEDKLDDRENIKYLTTRIMDLEQKINAVVTHLNLQFEDARFNLQPRK